MSDNNELHGHERVGSGYQVAELEALAIRLAEILAERFEHRFNQLETHMSNELDAAVTRIKASVKSEIDAVIVKLNEVQQPDPSVASAVADLNALSDTLDAETGSITGATGTDGSTPSA